MKEIWRKCCRCLLFGSKYGHYRNSGVFYTKILFYIHSATCKQTTWWRHCLAWVNISDRSKQLGVVQLEQKVDPWIAIYPLQWFMDQPSVHHSQRTMNRDEGTAYQLSHIYDNFLLSVVTSCRDSKSRCKTLSFLCQNTTEHELFCSHYRNNSVTEDFLFLSRSMWQAYLLPDRRAVVWISGKVVEHRQYNDIKTFPAADATLTQHLTQQLTNVNVWVLIHTISK